MGRRRENMLEAFKASHDQTVRNQRAAEAVEASRRIRAMVAGSELGEEIASADRDRGRAPVLPGEPIPVDNLAPPVPAVQPANTAQGADRGSQAGASEPVAAEVSDGASGAKTAKPRRSPKKAGPKTAASRPKWRALLDRRRVAKLDSDVESPAEGPGKIAKPDRSTAPSEAPAAAVRYASPDDAVEPVTLPMGWLPFLAMQLLMVGGAFGLGWIASGRASRPVEAATGPVTAQLPTGGLVLDVPDGGVHPEGAAGSPLRGGRGPAGALGAPDDLIQAHADSLRDPDLAFDNPDNRFTVVVAQYADTDFGRERAWDTFYYLEECGLPAVTPRARNGTVFLFAGAADEVSGLKELLEGVRGLQDRRGREFPFNDAYTANISRFL